jgi:tetratricopeptide (TPR) repeat protein
VIGGGNNINIGNNVGSGNIGSGNIGNRFGNNVGNGNWGNGNWGNGNWGNGNWGINGGNWNNHNWDHWHNNWHDCHINDHYGWYNGCWNNHWGYGAGWYAPAAIGWGLGTAYSSTYYDNSSYYNPYYDVAAQPAYDYSQPVVLANYAPTYATTDPFGGAAPAAVPAAEVPAAVPSNPPPPANDPAQAQFDQGLAEFKAGNYPQALAQFDSTLKQLPNDPVVHEVRALGEFAVGNYSAAAAGLNSLLATAPGMDWTTMAGLYGNVDDYSVQLRKLEQHCKTNPTDAPAAFVLAYHYLVAGHQDSAVNALKAVVKNQPKDLTAKRMLESLSPPEASKAPPETNQAPPSNTPAADAKQTDLVGTWQAKAGKSTIDLTIGDDSTFTWKVTTPDQPAVELKGDLTATSDMLVLESADQGSMVGRVTSGGTDDWKFAISGGPPNDPGLSFLRIK